MPHSANKGIRRRWLSCGEERALWARGREMQRGGGREKKREIERERKTRSGEECALTRENDGSKKKKMQEYWRTTCIVVKWFCGEGP